MTSVLSYSEDRGLARELSNGASLLAGAVGAAASAVVLDGLGETAPGGRVLVLRSELPLAGDYEKIAGALAAAAKAKDSSIILIGATKQGRQVAGKLSVMAGMGVLSDVRSLRMEGGPLTGVRGVYAARFNATVASDLPCIALVPAGCFQAESGAPREVEEMAVGSLPSRVRHLETRPRSKGAVDLRTAEIIVAAGRGFKRKEDLALAETLVKALGGALGSSRPLTSDLGWLSEEHHIGLTGIYVRPRLYVAVGISGQLQHVAGIKDSKVIVAINKDKQAPIFQVADYGIVGDLYQVIPALLAALAA